MGREFAAHVDCLHARGVQVRTVIRASLMYCAAAALAFAVSAPATATTGTVLSSVLSQAPVNWTPNVSAAATVGGSACNATFFGSGNLSCQSEVYDTAYVNGDVVAVGAFTEACQPGTLAQGLCKPGTQVTRQDIFAYAAGTGLIDPNFAPVLNAGPAWSVIAGPPGSNAVYVGGAFSSVNGVTHKGLVELNVNPGVTTGATADGSIVASFKGSVSSSVRDLALSPDSKALYVGGQFTSVDSATKFSNGNGVAGLARLNATTGALDNSFGFTLGDPIPGDPIKVEAMALSPDGTELAVSGTALQVNGQSRPRLAIFATGGTLGAAAALSDWTAPILANNCSAEHDYVRGLAFAPDGTFIAIGTTGYQNDGSMPFSACDAVARFNVNASNTTTSGTPVDVAPAWINYGGGDSFYSVAVAGNVVYAGGHDRWVNNYCGNNAVCEPNALLVNGISALDANTGLGLPWWHPQTLRGHGTMYLSTFPAGTYDGAHPGLALGTDVDLVGGAYHGEEALFPMASTTPGNSGGSIPSGMFNEEDGNNTSMPMCLDDPSNAASAGTTIDLATCTNSAEQNWTLSSGTVQINGMCLDTLGGSTAGSPAAALEPCDGSSTQQWVQGAGNTLANVGLSAAQGAQTCLDDPGSATASGTPLDATACSGGTNQVWPLPAAQGPPAPPAVGPIYPQEEQSSTQVPCLDDSGDSSAAGNPVYLWTCRGDAEQNWTTESNGTIQINGMCLDTAGAATTSLTQLVIATCNGSATQQWSPNQGSNYQLVNQGATVANGTPYCMDDLNLKTSNGSPVGIYACNGGNNQAWRIPTT
jgi:hypothetical protein